MHLRNDIAKQSQANTERSGDTTPINLQATASHCLILIALKVSSFQSGEQERYSNEHSLLSLHRNPKTFLNTKKAWS